LIVVFSLRLFILHFVYPLSVLIAETNQVG